MTKNTLPWQEHDNDILAQFPDNPARELMALRQEPDWALRIQILSIPQDEQETRKRFQWLFDGRLFNRLTGAAVLALLVVVLGFWVFSISTTNVPATTPASTVESTAYPPSSESNENVGYPPYESAAEETADPYPPPVATDKPLFQLDLPLTAGAPTVTGQAPESLPLAIVDITFGGIILGTGQSDEDGRFSIPVTPLPEGHRVGVTITEIEAGITFEEIAEQYFPYRGQGFINVPNVGVFYDSAITEP
jgi:hypothetical protein